MQLRKLFTAALATSLAFSAVGAKAAVRPQVAQFGIVPNEDFQAETLGWAWAGIGALFGLGLIVLVSGGSNDRGNSPR